MTTIKPGLDAISIRRTTIADGKKVRYRIYTSPSDYTVVFAESALMAVRTSGVAAPYKIVRELPGEGGKVDSQQLVQNDSVALNPAHARPAAEEMKQLLTELADKQEGDSILFVPTSIADLRTKGMTRARILPVEMLQEIIEEHAKTHPQEAVAPTPAPTVPETPAEIHRPPPEPTQAEKVAALADQVLSPSDASAPAAPVQETELSPEEVQKLLNE